MNLHFAEGIRMSLERGDEELGWLTDENIEDIAKTVRERRAIREDENRRDYYDADDMDQRVSEFAEDSINALLESWWRMFGDIPIDEDERIEEPFMGWPVGTGRMEIWQWFDALYKGGVHGLMYED